MESRVRRARSPSDCEESEVTYWSPTRFGVHREPGSRASTTCNVGSSEARFLVVGTAMRGRQPTDQCRRGPLQSAYPGRSQCRRALWSENAFGRDSAASGTKGEDHGKTQSPALHRCRGPQSHRSCTSNDSNDVPQDNRRQALFDNTSACHEGAHRLREPRQDADDSVHGEVYQGF